MTSTKSLPGMRTVWAIAAACILLVVVAVFAILLTLQRRRRRTQMLLALAAEDAERRRKKRKRAGLRSAEIDKHCPELIVVPAGTLSGASSDINDSEAAEDEPSAVSRTGADKLGSREPRESAAEEPAYISNGSGLAPKPVEIAEGCETCVVCLDDMVVDELVRRLPCSHMYHSPCIRIWLRRKNACPCCCKTVVKRRRKKPRVNLDPMQPPALNMLEEPPGVPELPVEPPRAASFDNARRTCAAPQVFATSISMPAVDADVNNSYVIDMELLRMRSAENDRPRPIAQVAFSRTGSLLDPDDPESEVMQSEASSRFDENMMGELLEHVRQVILGGDEITTDGEMSDVYMDFNDDEDSALFDGNVQLNRPFHSRASPRALPRVDVELRPGRMHM